MSTEPVQTTFAVGGGDDVDSKQTAETTTTPEVTTETKLSPTNLDKESLDTHDSVTKSDIEQISHSAAADDHGKGTEETETGREEKGEKSSQSSDVFPTTAAVEDIVATVKSVSTVVPESTVYLDPGKTDIQDYDTTTQGQVDTGDIDKQELAVTTPDIIKYTITHTIKNTAENTTHAYQTDTTVDENQSGSSGIQLTTSDAFNNMDSVSDSNPPVKSVDSSTVSSHSTRQAADSGDRVTQASDTDITTAVLDNDSKVVSSIPGNTNIESDGLSTVPVEITTKPMDTDTNPAGNITEPVKFTTKPVKLPTESVDMPSDHSTVSTTPQEVSNVDITTFPEAAIPEITTVVIDENAPVTQESDIQSTSARSSIDIATVDPLPGNAITTERSQDAPNTSVAGNVEDSNTSVISTTQSDTVVKTTDKEVVAATSGSWESTIGDELTTDGDGLTTGEDELTTDGDELTTDSQLVGYQSTQGATVEDDTTAGIVVPATPRLPKTTARLAPTTSRLSTIVPPVVTPGGPKSTPKAAVTTPKRGTNPVISTTHVPIPQTTTTVPRMKSTLPNIEPNKTTPNAHPKPEVPEVTQVTIPGQDATPHITTTRVPPVSPIVPKTTTTVPSDETMPVTPDLSTTAVRPKPQTTPKSSLTTPQVPVVPGDTTLAHTPRTTTLGEGADLPSTDALPKTLPPTDPLPRTDPLPATTRRSSSALPPSSTLSSTTIIASTTLLNGSLPLPGAQEGAGVPLWVILVSSLVAIAVLAIICLIVFLCFICRRRKRTPDAGKDGRDLWANTSNNYVSAMNEYTYVDMGTLSSQNAQQQPVIPGQDSQKMETAFDSDFNYDVIEDDSDVKWKNMWLSESKEQMDTTGLSANTDLDEETYAQGISTFRSPSKQHTTPSKVMDNKMADYPNSVKKSDPSTHEYAVPVITPKQSASSSLNSLHVPDSAPEPMAEAAELNFPAIVPPSSIKPLLKSNKPQRSPAKRSSKHLSAERNKARKNNPEVTDSDPDYMPVTVIYNENTSDQLI